jgi:hypothetical protein
LAPASENPTMQQSSLARFFEHKKDKIKKTPSKWKPKSALGVRKMLKAMQHMYDNDADDDEDDDDEEEDEDEDEDDDDDDDIL